MIMHRFCRNNLPIFTTFLELCSIVNQMTKKNTNLLKPLIKSVRPYTM